MCGLYGSITKADVKLTKAEKTTRAKILKGLAIAMQNRGTHSTGIAGMGAKTYSYFKQAVSAKEFVDSEGMNEVLMNNHNMFIGHTRYATVGEHTNENAHPFLYDTILGCHNGGVSNHKDIQTENKVEFNVDSEAIFYLLDKYKNDYKKALKELRGNFGITWFDLTKAGTFHMVINGRPLFIGRVAELQSYFYASEEFALQAVIASHYPIANKDFWTPKTDYVYEINSKNLQIKKTKIAFKPVEVYKPTYSTNYASSDGQYANGDPYYRGEGGDWDDREGVNQKVSDLIGTASKEAEVWRKLMDLKYEDMKQIRVQVEGDGCMFCTRPLFQDIEEGFFWLENERVALCLDCADELDVESSTVTWIAQDDYMDILFDLEEAEKDVPEEEGASASLAN